jgi:RNA polymerase sigma factor (sigma-70 family)
MKAANRNESEVRDLAIALYRNHRDYLLAIARRHAANERHAEEALQEAFISFLRAFDPDQGAPPIAWLITTLKRECWRKKRKEHFDRKTSHEPECQWEESGSLVESIPSHAPGPEQRVLECDEARRHLAVLRPDQRTALGFLAAGFSYKEIAARRGWTYTKVDRCVRRGRAGLRAVQAMA